MKVLLEFLPLHRQIHYIINNLTWGLFGSYYTVSTMQADRGIVWASAVVGEDGRTL